MPIIHGFAAAFLCSLLRSLLGISLVESVHAARSVYKLLFTGEEGMTGGTNFHVKVIFLGRSRFERLATRAGDTDFIIFRMNSRFHDASSSFALPLYRQRNAAISKQVMIGGSHPHRQVSVHPGANPRFRSMLSPSLTNMLLRFCGKAAKFNSTSHDVPLSRAQQ